MDILGGLKDTITYPAKWGERNIGDPLEGAVMYGPNWGKRNLVDPFKETNGNTWFERNLGSKGAWGSITPGAEGSISRNFRNVGHGAKELGHDIKEGAKTITEPFGMLGKNFKWILYAGIIAIIGYLIYSWRK